MSQGFSQALSAWASSFIRFQQSAIEAGAAWAALPLVVGTNLIESESVETNIKPETDIILREAFHPFMGTSFDELALMIAEAEGMTAVSAPRVKADRPEIAKEPKVEHKAEQGVWTYTRPHANQDEEWLERRTGRMVYTPQGGTPDSPSAKRVLERHRARKLRQVI